MRIRTVLILFAIITIFYTTSLIFYEIPNLYIITIICGAIVGFFAGFFGIGNKEEFGKERQYICGCCLHIFRGMPKKDKISQNTDIATTIKFGEIYTTSPNTSSDWTGNWWCGECRALGDLSIFPQVLIPRNQRKKLNKIVKKVVYLDIEAKIVLLLENGVDFGTKWG